MKHNGIVLFFWHALHTCLVNAVNLPQQDNRLNSSSEITVSGSSSLSTSGMTLAEGVIGVIAVLRA